MTVNFAFQKDIEFFKVLAEESPNMIFINFSGKVVYANKKCEEIMGYTRREFYSKSFDFLKLTTPEFTGKTKQAYAEHLKGKEVEPYEYKLKTKSGKIISAIITTKLIKINNETAILGVITNISYQKQIENELIDSKQNYITTIDSLPELIHVVDRKCRILLVNTAFKKMNSELGISPDIVGKTIFQAFPFLPIKKITEEYEKVFRSGKTLTTEEIVTLRNREIYTETRKVPITVHGKVEKIVTAIRDITRAKADEKKLISLNKALLKSNKKLERLVVLDSHTGLYNHRFLGKILETEFSRAKHKKMPISMLLIDLDYFKSINDLYGHRFGDMVLRQFAQKLKKLVRKYDTVIRYGGEEFVVILPNTECKSAKTLAQRVRNLINLEYFGSKKSLIKLRLSIAVSTYPQDNIANSSAMLELSDKILNKAKAYGGNRVFSSEDLKLENPEENIHLGNRTKTGVNYLKARIERLHKRANQGLIEAVFAFAKAIELKDHYTGEHVERTAHFAAEIARSLGMPKEEVMHIRQAAILHDLGKVGISEKILLKKAKLTGKEFEEIMEHPLIGADIIRPIHLLHYILPYIMHHHERWDGKGYPQRLKGEKIPLGARVICLADTFQALISNRPYRKAFSKKKAIQTIIDNSGTKFDPQVVDAFLEVVKKS
ncbi:MAG: diguanylate cyclase [Elusimicrobia bacterium]|nr:diguanylate cyclase [Candidatus Liberimonas magnetica]